MRNSIDFTSWSGLLSTLAGLAVVSLVAIGIRLVFMQTVQRRRERENRQINERLKTLIAAYKVLGGSFTGNLSVDPTHLRDHRQRQAEGVDDAPESASERRRRIRDAVEAALSDVILLGTEEQVRLAAQGAADMVAGRSVEVSQLVSSLRSFIRHALDLDPIPADLPIPAQGPLRAAGGTQARRGGNSGREGAGGLAGRGGGSGDASGGGGGLGLIGSRPVETAEPPAR
ncbi:hypothetical protein [Xenophilus azovorans]|uniref:hypothetical protein n=1 Tax=Xenophilus azovorans TaxID=151755 RepID=UPI0009FF36D9|nr:hypothetical protein [Xenophilus azovorans]